MAIRAYLVASVAAVLTAGCGGLGRADDTAAPAGVAEAASAAGRIPPLTEAQARAVQPVLDSLAEWIARIGRGFPELADFHREKALFRAPDGMGLIYLYNVALPDEKRALRPEDFGPNGLYLRFTCAPVPLPGEPPYAMAPPTRTLPTLGLHLWADVRAGPTPSAGLLEQLRALLGAHVEMLIQQDRAAGGVGAATPDEEEVLAALRGMLDARDRDTRLARRVALLALGAETDRLTRAGLRGEGPLTPEEAALAAAMLGDAGRLRAALDDAFAGGAQSEESLRLLVAALTLDDAEACGPIVDLIEAASLIAVPALAEGLSSPRIATRAWADELLARIGPAAIPALHAVLRDGPAIAHFHAVRALRTIGDPETVPALIGALKDPDPYARLEAANALEEIGDERARGPLLEALNDPANAHTAALFGIASAVGAFRMSEAFERLAELSQDPNWLVRQAVLVPLARTGDERALPLLLALLADPRSEARAEAATALGVLRRREAVPGLLAALEDPSAQTAARAAWALGEIGDPRAADALRRLATGKDPLLARAAAEAVGKVER